MPFQEVPGRVNRHDPPRSEALLPYRLGHELSHRLPSRPAQLPEQPAVIETPTLLLCGDGDFFVNQGRLDYTCSLYPNCEVHSLIEGAGAFIGLEQPEAYARAIVEFLKRP